MARCLALPRWKANVPAVAPVAVAQGGRVVTAAASARVRCLAVAMVSEAVTVASVVATEASAADDPAVAMASAVATAASAVSVARWALAAAPVVRAVKVAMDSALQSGAGKHP